MDSVLILEDNVGEGLENKSKALADRLAKTGLDVRLFDGRVCRRIKFINEKIQEYEKIEVSATSIANSETAVGLLEHHFKPVKRLVLVIDLWFGSDEHYGQSFYDALLNSDVFFGRIEPVIYSRYASDDRRRDLCNKFHIDGHRVLQRDTDTDIDVLNVVQKLLSS